MMKNGKKKIVFSALLPMKGHSERVKNKNVRNFNGRPLFYYILDTLRECEYIGDIYIDTDSLEIESLAKAYDRNIKIIKRPECLCGDMISMNRIIQYDLSQIGNHHFIQTHSTNPLLKVKTLTNACEKFISGMERYDSIFSVNRIQTRLYDQNACPMNHNPKFLIRTQDLPPLFEENSNFYIFSRESFLKNNSRIGSNPQMMEMDPLESIDIDEETDFVLAETLYRMRNGEDGV